MRPVAPGASAPGGAPRPGRPPAAAISGHVPPGRGTHSCASIISAFTLHDGAAAWCLDTAPSQIRRVEVDLGPKRMSGGGLKQPRARTAAVPCGQSGGHLRRGRHERCLRGRHDAQARQQRPGRQVHCHGVAAARRGRSARPAPASACTARQWQGLALATSTFWQSPA